MSKYRVTVCREIWGFIEVEASSDVEAMEKVDNGEYDSEFVQTKFGHEGIYNAVPVNEEE